jgi:hypothetical protein
LWNRHNAILTCQVACGSGGEKPEKNRKNPKKKPAHGGLFKSIEATYLAGAFFDAFLLFFGFAVALFMVSHLS